MPLAGPIEGGHPIEGARSNVYAVTIGASALATGAVLASVSDTGTAQAITTNIIGLDRPRRLTASVSAATAADIKAIQVTVVGKDIEGNTITEALPAFTDDTAGTVTGRAVFASITSITIPPHDGTSAKTSVGAAGLPAAANTSGVHAAVTDTGTAQALTTGFMQPDCPRNITAFIDGATAGVAANSVVVRGRDAEGNAISETLPTFTANTTGGVNGRLAFMSVTGVTLPKQTTTGVSIAIGFGEVLGINRRLSRNSVVSAFLNGTLEGTAPTVTVGASTLASNTADLNSALTSTPVIVELVQP